MDAVLLKIKDKLLLLLSFIVVGATCFGGGWLYSKSTIKPEIVTQIQTQVVEKIVEVEQKDKQTYKVTNITRKPDKSEQIQIVESSKFTSTKNVKTDIKVTKQAKQTITPKLSQYKVGILAKVPPINIKKLNELQLNYGAEFELRLPLNFWAGAFIYKNGELGIKLGLGAVVMESNESRLARIEATLEIQYQRIEDRLLEMSERISEMSNKVEQHNLTHSIKVAKLESTTAVLEDDVKVIRKKLEQQDNRLMRVLFTVIVSLVAGSGAGYLVPSFLKTWLTK